ncbi:MAG: hypothetical protein ACLUO4_06480 [Christensenellales bacterium]
MKKKLGAILMVLALCMAMAVPALQNRRTKITAIYRQRACTGLCKALEQRRKAEFAGKAG